MRFLALGLAATFAVAGCAVSNTPYPRAASPVVYRAPPGPNHFTTAPRAPLHSEVFVCNSWSSNLGLIGDRGEVSNYRPYMDTAAGPLLRTPIDVACFSSGFGWRGAATGGGRQHNGIDLANPEGGYVYAAGDGWVRFAGERGGYGIVLELDHGRGVLTRYAHLNEIDPNLQPGMFVAAGAPVARMGMTGNATGVHLHYEVVIDGLLVDPMNYGVPQYVTTPVIDAAPTDTPEF
ncbi:MAG: M23 family metallopeptidase [Hyphomonadaceae bacterium]